MRRIAIMAVSVVLVAGTAAACGDDSKDAAEKTPAAASEKDFCGAIEKVGKSGEDFDKYQDAIEDLSDLGTPKGISDDARDAFEFLVDEVDKADDESDLKKVGEDMSADEKKQSQALNEYVGKTCA